MQLLRYMLKKRVLLVACGAAGCTLAVIAALYWNGQISVLINCINAGEPLPIRNIMIAFGTLIAISAINYAKEYVGGIACEWIVHDLRMGYGRYFAGLSAMEAEGLNTGEEISKLQNEIGDVGNYLSANLFILFDDGLRFIFTIVWLMMLSPVLTLAANGPVILIAIYIFYASRVISAATYKSQQSKENMNRYADSLITMFPIVRLYNAGMMLVNSYKKAVTEWEQQAIRAEGTRARLMSLSGVMSSMPLIILFMVGGYLVISSQLSIGTLYIFLNLSGNVSGVMMNMPGHIAGFRQFLANMERIEPYIILDKSEQ